MCVMLAHISRRSAVVARNFALQAIHLRLATHQILLNALSNELYTPSNQEVSYVILSLE